MSCAFNGRMARVRFPANATFNLCLFRQDPMKHLNPYKVEAGAVLSVKLRNCSFENVCIGGSVVECSPATRAARVRFPANATFNLCLFRQDPMKHLNPYKVEAGAVLSVKLRNCSFENVCIGGSVVECSPATRAARVRFPANATFAPSLPK